MKKISLVIIGAVIFLTSIYVGTRSEEMVALISMSIRPTVVVFSSIVTALFGMVLMSIGMACFGDDY